MNFTEARQSSVVLLSVLFYVDELLTRRHVEGSNGNLMDWEFGSSDSGPHRYL